MSDVDTAPVNVRVDKDTKELAKQKLDHGGLTEVVEEALARVAHGEETTERQRVQDHLEELRSERAELRSERDSLNDRLDELDRKIARAEERLDSLMEQDGEYDGMLQMLEERLHSGKPVDKSIAEVKRAAETGGKEPREVISDLQERNPDVPEDAYQNRDARTYNWKIESGGWDARKDEPVDAAE